MFKKIKLFLQVLLLQFSARSQALPFEELPHTNPLHSEFDSILHEQVRVFFKKSGPPGLMIGISLDGKKSFYSYGYADTVSKKVFGPGTVFEVGSITKTFTANLLLQLDAKKTISIEKPLSAYIPGVEINDSVLSKVLLKDIARHTSGLPRLPTGMDNVEGYAMMQPYAYYKKENLYAFLKELRKVKPGSYLYSNLGFGILATIMENETKNSFESLLASHIWKPLGMENSYIRSDKQQEDSATGYFYGKPAEYWIFDCMAGAGAIKSNVTDLLKYLDAHITTENTQLADAIKKVTEPAHSVNTNMQIGYGWHVLENLKHRVVWHNGGTYGFSTYAAFEPVTKCSIVLASNASGVNAALDKLAVDLLILLMGK